MSTRASRSAAAVASDLDHTHCGFAGFLSAGCYRLEYHFGLGVACQEDDLEVILPVPVRLTPPEGLSTSLRFGRAGVTGVAVILLV